MVGLFPKSALAVQPKEYDRVRIFQGGYVGVVKYVGAVEFADGVWIGLELDDIDPEDGASLPDELFLNTHSGTVKGKKYYDVRKTGHHQSPRGFFTQQRYLIENLGSSLKSPLPEATSVKVEVGDTVKLADGTVGTVKYVGKPKFDEEEMIGIEADTWDPSGHDGSVRGRKYFRARKGRGLFTRRLSIAEVIDPTKLLAERRESMLATLPDVGDRIKLRDGTEGVVQWIEEAHKTKTRKKIQVKMLDEVGDLTAELRVLTLASMTENLGRHLDKETIAKKCDFEVGDHVRLVRNKTGIVRYIGSMSGKVEKDLEDEVVGIELDLWSASGHDGKGLFTCAPQHGYFTKRDHVLEKIEPLEGEKLDKLQTKRQRQMRRLRNLSRKAEELDKTRKGKRGRTRRRLSEEEKTLLANRDEIVAMLRDLTNAYNMKKPPIEIDEVVKRELVTRTEGFTIAEGDRVVLDTGESGRVVFSGEVHFDDREMFGILLDEWSPNGHNGTVDYVPYFVVDSGRGLLVPQRSIIEVVPPAIAAMEVALVDGMGLFGASSAVGDEDDPLIGHGRRDSVEWKDEDDEEALVETILSAAELKELPVVGSRITLGSKTGLVKWIGKTEFSDEPVIGLELDSWSANATDGTLMGHKYFDADEGKGFFIRKQSYASMKEILASSSDDGGGLFRRDSMAISGGSEAARAVYFDIGDCVLTTSGHVGESYVYG